jgi:hypothetical protein
MSRRPALRTQADISKVAKAVAKTMVKTGLDWRMEIEPGKITFVVASDADRASPPTSADDLDRELADFEARHG